MELEETCACGASFRAVGDNVTRLLKAWRKDHICDPKPPENSESVVTTTDTKTEISLGFAPTELSGRQDFSLE